MIEINSVVATKIAFEYTENSKFNEVFELQDYQDPYARLKMKGLQWNLLHLYNIFFEALLEELKPVVTAKFEVQYWNKSGFWALLVVFELSGS